MKNTVLVNVRYYLLCCEARLKTIKDISHLFNVIKCYRVQCTMYCTYYTAYATKRDIIYNINPPLLYDLLGFKIDLVIASARFLSVFIFFLYFCSN